MVLSGSSKSNRYNQKFILLSVWRFYGLMQYESLAFYHIRENILMNLKSLYISAYPNL